MGMNNSTYQNKQHIKKENISSLHMAAKRKSLLIISILLFSLISNVQASEESTPIAQFGTGFTEVVIADTSDDLFDPRDLEFHPGRANELWIANGKEVWCEKKNGSRIEINRSKDKKLNEMILVTSKNHRNSILEN